MTMKISELSHNQILLMYCSFLASRGEMPIVQELNSNIDIEYKKKPVNIEQAKNLALWYDTCTDYEKSIVPNNVQSSYNQLVKETILQYEFCTQVLGIVFKFTSNDPYTSSKEMFTFIENTNVLHVFSGGEPIGLMCKKVAGNSINILFRAIHDILGHYICKNSFSAQGEENAYQSHKLFFTDKAIPALAMETRGQNSWVNFGPHMWTLDENNVPIYNSCIRPSQRPYAEQKLNILPQFLI